MADDQGVSCSFPAISCGSISVRSFRPTCKLIGGTTASIDQSALTGDLLPVAKKIGDPAYSGSIIKDGDMTGVVTATGSNTLFGRTAKLVASAAARQPRPAGMFEIGDFLVVTAIALALIMVGFDVYRDIVTPAHWQWQDALGILQFVLILSSHRSRWRCRRCSR